ncbi:uncharacterized protein LOC119075384 [Bradysia coprophila]|uniref:uncharacterized protein LOC119075384 n=1 Tax=Bradysia coprophila TaxID=38358 RepID=UPI00187DD3C8|nr:uncharacterized protein LOC119075384 [Bradysia coprophila]
MSTAFYCSEAIQLYVHNSKTLLLRLDDFVGERDTCFIGLPSTDYSDKRREKFRFYTVLNYSDDVGNEFGLWIYVYHPSFNYKIQGCTFRVIKGMNAIVLPPTTVSDAVVGIYRSPCYDIVNNEGILDFLIHFPNMTFETSELSDWPVQSEDNDGGAAHTDAPVTANRMEEVNLGDDLSTAFKEMMKQTDYDVYFVVDGTRIGSFKFALCAVSDVFRATFKNYTQESQSGEIVIHDFGHNIVQMFVDALHTHKIYFNDDPVVTLELGMLANKYNVECIEKAAKEAFNVMDVNRHNFVDVYRLAAYDKGIMDQLMRRFIEMRVDTNDIVGFEELTDKTKIDFYRSAHQKTIGK